eukprot:3932217-Rhodomonas_salina.3
MERMEGARGEGSGQLLEPNKRGKRLSLRRGRREEGTVTDSVMWDPETKQFLYHTPPRAIGSLGWGAGSLAVQVSGNPGTLWMCCRNHSAEDTLRSHTHSFTE